MRRLLQAVHQGRSAHPGFPAAAWAAAVFFLLAGFGAPPAGAQGTPAGTPIRNWATLTYTSAGQPYAVASDTAEVVVGQVAGVDLQPPRVSTGAVGTSVVFAHLLTNVGNGPDSFTVAAVSSHGWPVTLYHDRNGDGILDAGDSALTGPVPLGYGGLAHLLASVAIPNNPTVLGVSDTVAVTVTSRFNSAVGAAVGDRVDVPAAPLAITLTKQVDRATAVVGDALTYTLGYVVTGGGNASSAEVADTIPVGSAYVPGTLRWNGTPLTDAVGDDAGSVVPAGGGVVAVDLGPVASGASGTVTFQVQATPGPPRTIANRGDVVFAWAGGSDTVQSNSVQTAVLVPVLSLDKRLTSPPVALIGQQVHYALRYGNAVGAAAALNVVLTDTLPTGLQYVSAMPAPSISGGGQVLSWPLGTLPAGDSGVIDVVLSVAPSVRDTVLVRNVAFLEAQSTTALPAAAAPLTLVGPPSVALGLDLSADVLDVGVGEAIPYRVAVQNPGTMAVANLQIAVRLSGAARYAPGSAIGADSSVLAGGRLILFTGAALPPGATRTLRFVATLASAPGTVVEARATASGQASSGLAGSPEAIAWVQVRRAWPMETRAAIGRVWVDANGDGVQRSGELGLASIDVWTEDGQVATTDSTGKFSFSNLRPGQHAFRVDPRSIPEGYRLASDDARLVEASGWTTPRVDFRVIPTGTSRVDAVTAHRSVTLNFTALPQGSQVRYEVTLRAPQDFAFDALASFSPLADSGLVYVGGAVFTRYPELGTTAIPIPSTRPGADIRIVAWSSQRSDSAMLRVIGLPSGGGYWNPAGRTESVARAYVRNASKPVVLTMEVPASALVAIGSGNGAAGASADTERVTVPAERTVAERDTERRAGLVRGPGIEIIAPVDGAVLGGDRVYVGVRGEADAAVVLYDGTKLLDSVRTRIDGVYDFVAVPLARGPHRLRVALHNSWGQQRWDSVAIHVTGLPARFDVPRDPAKLVADGRSTAVLHARVLDAWGVPVAQPAYVTVSATGGEPLGADADPSSVGLQLLSSAAGRLAITLRSGRAVGPGTLTLKSGDASITVPLELLPEVRALTIAGSGLVGVGASPDAYGAVTARGRFDERTSFTLGLDSRRLNDGRDVLGRSADPLEESQYPILGDASRQETRTASQTWLSARVERGFDWAQFGDLSSTDFASGLSLAQYRRTVTGVAAHVTTGAVTWSGFGSLTAQALRQLQVRGAGVSGPYLLAADILPGSEVLRVETRAIDNPERAVVTQGLVRFVDYQIDYTAGVVLFKQPIPASDEAGNPVFIVATFEAASGGEQRLVAGARAALDVRRLAGALRLDSLRLGVTAVQVEQAVNPYRLVGSDLRLLRVGSLDVGAEVAHAEQGDSTGLAGMIRAAYSPFGGALTFGARYMQVGREFSNPSNVAVQPGLTEVSLKSSLKLGATELRLEHSRQDFELQGVEREHSRVGVVQHVRPDLQVDAGLANDVVGGASPTASEATVAELKARWGPSPQLQFWSEVRRPLSLSGPDLSPEVWGFGGTYRVTSTMALEASQRFVSRPDTGGDYSVSSIGVRADVTPETQAWGRYELNGGINGAGNAAVVGLRNRLQLSGDLALSIMTERRIGVSRASLADPVRALPFLQPEDDYWSAAAGLELLPHDAPYRLSARGEYKDGVLQSSRLATVAGTIAFDASLALLSRQEFVQNARPGAPLSRRLSSLWGLALRPAHTDRLNMLAKFQWTDDRNPIGGGVLVSQGAERKAIAAAEMIWNPVPTVELAGRYAGRRTQADRVYADSTPQRLTSWADYIGGRVSVDVTRWLSLRTDTRLLVERVTGTTRGDAAPAVVVRPVRALEIAAGYRYGDLNDPDFSVRGGHGAFVTVSAAVTEQVFSTAAEFWRRRF